MSEHLTHPFEQVYQKTERVIKFFERLTQMGKWLTNQFKRLIKISKRVPQMTERLTQTIISQNSRTSQEAILFLLEWNFYWIISTITTVCEHASLIGTVIFPKTTSGKPLNSVKSFFKSKMHSAHVNNFIQILVEIWPTGNLNMWWSVVWWDDVMHVCRLFNY